MTAPSIIWFRQDLRLSDQRAVAAAAAAEPVLPVFVLDDAAPGQWCTGAAARWWLHHSLASLDADLRAKGARLILLRGDAVEVLAALARDTGAAGIHATDHVEPWARRQQASLAERLPLRLHDGWTLVRPDTVRTGSGGRYRIFTPFWGALQRLTPPPPPLPAPERVIPAAGAPDGLPLAALDLLPRRPNWAAGWETLWQPGEAGAQAALRRFLGVAHRYGEGRNIPGEQLTSRLSPHLHWGEISAASVWHSVEAAVGWKVAEPFLRELGWRDFAAGLIEQFPESANQSQRAPFNRLAWRDDPEGLADWQRGLTGYPLVDAGMRELWATGWMHNRVRMVVAAFLTKHLLIDWRTGARWFWDTLVDADLGSNTLGWQWSAGSGVDSQMFSRIMDPVAQGRRWDADGTYVRRWVPELAAVPLKQLHAPWEAPGGPPAPYPRPIVDHRFARKRALAAWAAAKG
jgi:deoxyribodipyrimidine photo-lyase